LAAAAAVVALPLALPPAVCLLLPLLLPVRVVPLQRLLRRRPPQSPRWLLLSPCPPRRNGAPSPLHASMYSMTVV